MFAVLLAVILVWMGLNAGLAILLWHYGVTCSARKPGTVGINELASVDSALNPFAFVLGMLATLSSLGVGYFSGVIKEKQRRVKYLDEQQESSPLLFKQ